jgi:hypothetical protein
VVDTPRSEMVAISSPVLRADVAVKNRCG